jgi:hypothetical protein
VALRTGAPGSGGTNTSGSTRVVATWAASAHLGGQHAVLDEEHVAVELGALVAGPDLLDHAVELDPLPSGRTRSSATTSSSWRNWSSAMATQNSSGVASSVPMTRPTPVP